MSERLPGRRPALPAAAVVLVLALAAGIRAEDGPAREARAGQWAQIRQSARLLSARARRHRADLPAMLSRFIRENIYPVPADGGEPSDITAYMARWTPVLDAALETFASACQDWADLPDEMAETEESFAEPLRWWLAMNRQEQLLGRLIAHLQGNRANVALAGPAGHPALSRLRALWREHDERVFSYATETLVLSPGAAAARMVEQNGQPWVDTFNEPPLGEFLRMYVSVAMAPSRWPAEMGEAVPGDFNGMLARAADGFEKACLRWDAVFADAAASQPILQLARQVNDSLARWQRLLALSARLEAIGPVSSKAIAGEPPDNGGSGDHFGPDGPARRPAGREMSPLLAETALLALGECDRLKGLLADWTAGLADPPVLGPDWWPAWRELWQQADRQEKELGLRVGHLESWQALEAQARKFEERLSRHADAVDEGLPGEAEQAVNRFVACLEGYPYGDAATGETPETIRRDVDMAAHRAHLAALLEDLEGDIGDRECFNGLAAMAGDRAGEPETALHLAQAEEWLALRRETRQRSRLPILELARLEEQVRLAQLRRNGLAREQRQGRQQLEQRRHGEAQAMRVRLQEILRAPARTPVAPPPPPGPPNPPPLPLAAPGEEVF